MSLILDIAALVLRCFMYCNRDFTTPSHRIQYFYLYRKLRKIDAHREE